ncbi:cytidylyltransferase domain-containing protein [Treponema sp.]|uniref:cytidylyltransferase domain-containing protein n=1 Tax=Treponema sp. TaxID=166 RepID=UPI003F08D6D1
MNLKKIQDVIKKIIPERKKVVVIVQCRLSSTRLPGKALLNLAGKPILEWTLAAMKKVKASAYFLAVDNESKTELEPVAEKCGWNFYSGSQTDVLERFCDVIKLSKADVVVRATADNPFLFYEAAQELVDEYFSRSKNSSVDYITFSGLPHGSGVEVFTAASLLDAASRTNLPYDHEHVGPALYNHSENYNCIFLKAPQNFNYPEYRTTVDTVFDYRRAQKIVDILEEKNAPKPYSARDIISAVSVPAVKNPVVLIPSLKKGHGTGHLRRCLELAVENKWDLYMPDNADLTQRLDILEKYKARGLKDFQIVEKINDFSEYSLAVVDMFCSDTEFIGSVAAAVPVVGIDEGNLTNEYAEYLVDVLPRLNSNRNVNFYNPSFIPMPEKKRSSFPSKINTALVCVGGEDPAGLLFKSAVSLAENKVHVFAVASSENSAIEIEKNIPGDLKKFITVSAPVENLKNELFKYDLVVTHFGFTAYEAAGAGCAVLLLSSTPLHARLASCNGFKCLSPKKINSREIKHLLEKTENLSAEKLVENSESFSGFMKKLSMGKHFECPVCRSCSGFKNKIAARTKDRTYRKCLCCGITYMSWTSETEQTEYSHSYFFDDYKKQYGKTYLEDFYSIKTACMRRMSYIDFFYRITRMSSRDMPSVLDIGCAMGPFLSAANDSGWQVFGADVSQDAVDYVQHELNFPASCVKFPDADFVSEFGVEHFDAVTMWYVIEHFSSLDEVLKKVSSLVKEGGIFAFSTPSGDGVSARFCTDEFYRKSPADHYTIWNSKCAKKILRKYGFKVVKIVSTGIHPERLPLARKSKFFTNPFLMKVLGSACRFFRLGDTFEVYCKKIKS